MKQLYVQLVFSAVFFSSRYSSKTLNSRREIARGFETTIGFFDRRPNPVWSQPGEMAILFSGATIKQQTKVARMVSQAGSDFRVPRSSADSPTRLNLERNVQRSP